MASISLKELNKSYGALTVVHDIDLEIADKEFIILVGPSGCGKSTTLRMIAGLEEISGGELKIGGDVFFWGPLMAGALLGSIPVAIAYSFFVEHYVAGLTGSVKG